MRSTPGNVTWGEFPIDKPPVVVIQSGDTVRIDTLSHAGATQGATLGAAAGNESNHPVTYAGRVGPFYGGSLGADYLGRLSTDPPLIPAFGPVGATTDRRAIGGRVRPARRLAPTAVRG